MGKVQIASLNTTAFTSADYHLDVTSFVQSLVNNNGTFAGVTLRSSVESGVHGADFASSEFGNPYQPTLTIDFTPAAVSPVPEPASMITLAAGAIGMLGFRMRKRRLDAGLVA